MSRFLTSDLGRLRLVSLLEGVSYLVLLGIAMPLKYLAGDPLWVRIVGPIHGVLFILFVIAVARVARTASWSLPRSGWALVSSVIPLGAFVLERSLRREVNSARRDSAEQ